MSGPHPLGEQLQRPQIGRTLVVIAHRASFPNRYRVRQAGKDDGTTNAPGAVYRPRPSGRGGTGMSRAQASTRVELAIGPLGISCRSYAAAAVAFLCDTF